MRLSAYFLPVIKENPSEAQIVSHRLMLRAGMVRQSSAGIYSWLPLGFRVLQKVEQIVREEQDRAGAQEILMPTIQPADLWRESGRYDDYGKEMLRITDRHERDMLYGPTNEEQVTEIFRDALKSYRDLPKNLYHIQWKFRDEVRPRFGVMRGREFLMKDAYSFDLDAKGAKHSYNKMFVAYLRTYARMGLKAIPMRADTGPIGGDLSHEFIILADTGESAVEVDRDFLDTDWTQYNVDFDDVEGLQKLVDRYTSLYAATDEKHDPAMAAKLGDRLVAARGIEVGHIFYFGTKYSKSMGAVVAGPNGESVPVERGSYGIGVSRLVGRDHRGEPRRQGHHLAGERRALPRRPHQSARRRCRLRRSLRTSSMAASARPASRRSTTTATESPGAKFATMDLIGLPWQLVIGPRGVAAGTVELKNRKTGEKEEIPAEAALAKLTGRG